VSDGEDRGERPPGPTSDEVEYTRRMVRRSGRWWKRLFDTQAPYRWNLRRMEPGYVLDVGCGIGRNLANLDGHGVGVDTNVHSIAEARGRGLTAYAADAFPAGPDAVPGSFDSLLFAHVLEHMTADEARALVATYLPYLIDGGKVIVIVPQEAGFASDPTHVAFFDVDDVAAALGSSGLRVVRSYSFPFPRRLGRWFRHNETVVIAER
jgi:SAM-dependent methyltransferase